MFYQKFDKACAYSKQTINQRYFLTYRVERQQMGKRRLGTYLPWASLTRTTKSNQIFGTIFWYVCTSNYILLDSCITLFKYALTSGSSIANGMHFGGLMSVAVPHQALTQLALRWTDPRDSKCEKATVDGARKYRAEIFQGIPRRDPALVIYGRAISRIGPTYSTIVSMNKQSRHVKSSLRTWSIFRGNHATNRFVY